MIAGRAVGRGAASRKYDLLSALASHALSGPSSQQRLALRLIALITARYNWATDRLSIGRADIARLWHVDERTVKREMSKLRAMGWIVVHLPAVRGRVTVYGLGLEAILVDTRPSWEAVGPDLVERLTGTDAAEEEAPTVVPFPERGRPPTLAEPPGLWADARARLAEIDPARSRAWYARLSGAGQAGDILLLHAPNGFVAGYVETHLAGQILAVVRSLAPEISRLRVLAADAPDSSV
ncbi:hypothetical protein FDP22_21215 (plasmid) [Paroceanicella profunda]|uniref:DnaA N-terminal domain-containing protein n=1 Tax=Paroceanicella profunda TaxID=2579971 RepID=A0A5B8G101_9RHOB|nr:hypothetical protein [Paroceanicella profunda]QDL94395.1 hypothetical protein FDP22_21215 [Paroceanicella profunda]